MKFEIGELYQNLESGNVYLATTNGVVNRDGCLVMGKGSAESLKSKIANSPAVLGKLIGSKPGIYTYGLVCVKTPEDIRYGAFQTKRDWKDCSRLSLIAQALIMLEKKALANQQLVFHLPMPGIGAGGLTEGQVKRLLDEVNLPDNVVIWKRS